MKSLGNLPDPFLAEILGQPDALRRAADGLAVSSAPLEAVLAERRRASIVFTGMGASYNACYVPVTLLAARGQSSIMVDAAELLHFRRPILGDDSLLVTVSQSGESAEVVRLVEALQGRQGRPFIVSITNGTRNTLARAADVSLDTRAGEETGPSTMTFAATLVVLAAVSDALAGVPLEQAMSKVRAQASRAASEAEAILAKPEELAGELTSWFENRRAFALLGRGTARAASETGALVLKEAARVPAEALEAAQFRHGPLELAGRDLAAAVIATERETAALDLALAEELVAAGAAVLVVTNEAGGPDGTKIVTVPDVGRALGPALSVVPSQLLAWRLALDQGLSPGELQVASKVTTRE